MKVLSPSRSRLYHNIQVGTNWNVSKQDSGQWVKIHSFLVLEDPDEGDENDDTRGPDPGLARNFYSTEPEQNTHFTNPHTTEDEPVATATSFTSPDHVTVTTPTRPDSALRAASSSSHSGSAMELKSMEDQLMNISQKTALPSTRKATYV